MRNLHLIFIAASIIVLVSCGGGKSNGTGGGAEALKNPGFEEGKSDWKSLTTEGWNPDYALTSDITHSGNQAAYLALRTPPNTTGVRIFGVTQEVSPKEFPQELSGWYRVDNWVCGTPKQYLQCVVIVFGADNQPTSLPPGTNFQIRYILAGISEPPFRIDNAKYIFLHPQDPDQGAWIHFQVPVANDFKDKWGVVPESFDFIRLLCEVRYDDKAVAETPSADVYYDDMHMGNKTDGS
jgi:hypothetical protein